MTQNKDFKLPFNSLTNYVPQNLRNPVITGLIDNLFDRFLTHDESVPLYGYVGRKPSSPDDRAPRIPQLNVERDVNSVVPVLSFKLGAETHAFTVQDLIKKAEALGISPGNLQWLYSQGHNYLPPIDLDKFVNFFNYFWVAKSVAAVPNLPWNPTLAPEYYTIAAPVDSDLNKLNVVAASSSYIELTGSGFRKMSFKLAFTGPTSFTITPMEGGEPAQFPAIERQLSGITDHFEYKVGATSLIEFDIQREQIYDQFGNSIGLSSFETGDTFTIDTDFLTRNYIVNFSGGQGVKGKVLRVKPLNQYQVVDGVQLRAGDRVLVKGNSVDDTGIYIVSAGKWKRAPDFDGANRVPGARVFVRDGFVNGGKMFISAIGGGGLGFEQEVGATESNTNHWQEGNFWVTGESLAALGLSRNEAVQAVRPIIEYIGDVQLNSYVKDGRPSDSGTYYKQVKTEFNQLPLFDLYRYDGTHSGLVSSVFYYEEDVTANLDLKLQKRVLKSTNDSADFIFNHGMADDSGQLLFVKRNGELKTIWHPGYIEPVIIDQAFNGKGNGTLNGLEAFGFTQQQVWTLTATSDTTFKIKASKMPLIPAPHDVVTVGETYNNGEVSFLIQAGSIPFEADDSFVFRVGNLESPRYVYRDEDDAIVDRFGGPALDPTGEGAWQIPRTFYHNPYNDSRAPVDEGAAYSHFRGILSNQIPGKPIDYAFGGSMKLWSEQQTLLASMLMQRDMTPVSVIDLAQRQYETALNTVRDIFEQNIVQFVADNGPITDYDRLTKLLDFVQVIRSRDNDVRTVLYDSTSPLVGFPATLPQLGMGTLVEPEIAFDPVLGRTLLTHHDGHKSALFENNLALRQSIFGNLSALTIKRSDGTYTPAITPIANMGLPYKGELRQLVDGTVQSFNVWSDSPSTPANPEVGALWYKRTGDVLYQWDGLNWAQQPDVNAPWVDVNFADTLNSLLLLVETRLHDGINPNARKYDFTALSDDPEFKIQLQRELFAFSALNGYDPLGSDYAAADAFTWNYSRGFLDNFASLPGDKVPARWFDVLTAHQSTIAGVIPTERPNLEPWKLLGFPGAAAWWIALSDATREAYLPTLRPDDIIGWEKIGVVKSVQVEAANTVLGGFQTINGVYLNQGDRVLLTNEATPANNGVWIVSSAGWARAAGTQGVNVVLTVTSGNHKGTTWASTNVNTFTQVRTWSDKLWADIQLVHPNLKLSVDTTTDELLPPYVNPATAQAVNALTTFVPPNASLAYEFGDSSPIQTLWSRSLEHGYSQARALFRYDPLAFLGFCWGFNWVEVDGILYDGYDMSMPGHKRFRLHGDPIDIIERPNLAVTGNGKAVVTYTAYDTDRKANFTVSRDGQTLGYAQAGTPASIGGLQFTLKDEGRPFRTGDRYEIMNGVGVFVPAATQQYLGFGQAFTHALREVSIDTESSFAIAAFREWEVNMGYRAGGLVATDDLHVYTDSETLSESAFDLLFKKNAIARNEWIQALRISVTHLGQRVAKDYGFAPKTDGQDWTFRIEGYNPRHTEITYLDMSLDTDPIDFHVLSKAHTDTVWYQPTVNNGPITTNLPLSITGIQNVVNFLFGYQRYLESRGWEFNQLSDFNTDAETGRVRNFQLEIEKFVDRCYAGITLDRGHIVNPFVERAWFNQETGLMSEFVDTSLFDVSGHPGAFDVLGVKFKKEDLDVVRTNAQSSFGASAPMYSAHLQIDEFEHLFIFNNFAQQSTGSGLLYDPFSGARVATYKFNGRKQATTTMRPEFGGHFLVGNKVHQNLQASTDNIANLYDANHAFENETTTRHALALLGFNRKKYFDDLDISEKTQFNFWRGLIQSKGTNLSIDAYLNNNRFDDAKVDEYWAYKVAEYGDARPRIFPELKLTVNDSLTQFTRLQFDPAEGRSLSEFGFDTVLSFDDEHRWFSLDDMNQDVKFPSESVGTFYISNAEAGKTYTLPFVADALSSEASFTAINATTIVSNVAGELTIQGYGPSRPRFNPVKLFNYVENELVAEIPVWHPAAGQHTPTALESINIISTLNPAKYNYSKQVVNNNSYDPLRPWGAKEVGRVWFDTRNLAYVPYYDKQIFGIDERLSRWGTLADFATIDVYEWVQSSVPPAEYDALAAEQAGDAGLDQQTKAAGQVADRQTYSRTRRWEARPIAWSFSPVPVDVDWEATPPFPIGSNTAELRLSNGLAILDRGTFADLEIEAGSHIGAWDNDPSNPKPLSEYIVEDEFTKIVEDIQGGTLPPIVTDLSFMVEVEVTGGSDVAGQLLFSTVQPDIMKREGEEVWDVVTAVKVTEVSSGQSEVAVVTEAVGFEGGKEYIPYDPGQPYIKAVAHQEFRPANPGQPYIKHIEGQEFIPADPGQPYVPGIDGREFRPANPGQPYIAAQAGTPGVPGSPGQPYIAPTPASSGTTTPGTRGYHRIATANGTTIDTETGYNPDTTYSINLTLDAQGYGVQFKGSAAETYGKLANLLNENLPGNPVSIDSSGGLVLTANNTGSQLTMWESGNGITDSELNNMSGFMNVVVGVADVTTPGGAGNPGQPYIAPVAAIPPVPAIDGQEYIPPDPGQEYVAMVWPIDYRPANPGQPYIEHVEGQEFIPADPGQPYIQEVVGQEYIPPTLEQLAAPPSHLYGATISLVNGQKQTIELPEFQLKLHVTAQAGGTFPADAVRNAIVEALNTRVALRDAVVVTPIIPGSDTDLSNDLFDNDPRYGWRVWNVPTQAQLDADAQLPFSSWKPYIGAWTPIEGNLAEIQEAIEYAEAPFTLRSGEVVERYRTSWSEWSVLQNTFLTATSQVSGPVTFEHDSALDAGRVSVYVNGIAQLKAAFTIVGKVLTVTNVQAGSNVTIIIRKYGPTEAELSFDPDVLDDLSYQKQFKQDYEYVSLPVRDREGSLSSTIYFFWVKNKTTPALGKKQSVQSIAQQLRDGPPNFLTFQNISEEAPFTYDAITISGLSYIVTKDDTFKLRFTRNFTLRDDPEELNLKNVHTEWALMRPAQKTRIPESLWKKLTDSVAGIDAAGNTIPAIRRVLYDERNGTRTQFGFGPEQTLAPAQLLRSSIIDSILNTKLLDDGGTVKVPDYITFLDLDESDVWFANAENARKTMTDIWNNAKVAQVNEIFFAALNDVLASNYELSDIFKTSRISAYSIKVVSGAPVAPTFE